MRRAVEYFQLALAEDPGFAPAYAGIADSHAMLGMFFAAPHEEMPKARAAAKKALEMDNNLGEAHTSLAGVNAFYEWEWKAAEERLKQALELNPSYATAHSWYAQMLSALGRADQAVEERKHAQRLDPLSPIIATGLGGNLYMAGRYDEAVEQAHKTLELFPGYWPAQWVLGISYEQQSKLKEAVRTLEDASSLQRRNSILLGALGHAKAMAGDRKGTLEVLEELQELSKRGDVAPYDVAFVYVGLGATEQALEWLEKAYEERSGWLVMVKVDPRFKGLHSHARFRDLIRRMNFPE